jgi:hypothetical protein
MQPRHARRRHRLVPALLALGAGAAVVVMLMPLVAGTEPVRSASRMVENTGAERGSGPVVRAAAVLRAWDRARADAWAAGSVGALRRLYVDGAGASDVRMLAAYLDRGLRVRDLRVQVLALEVLERRPGEWRLRVTDRLASGVAVGAGGRQPLPRDRATTRLIRLERGGGRWRVVAVSHLSPARHPAQHPRRGGGR